MNTMEKARNLPLETARLCIRPFTPDDLESFRILVNIPDNDGFTMPARGKGHATETARAITSWAFDIFDIPYLDMKSWQKR